MEVIQNCIVANGIGTIAKSNSEERELQSSQAYGKLRVRFGI